jgi:hypothetical protein
VKLLILAYGRILRLGYGFMVPGFCGECGANIDGASRFCRQCGHPLANRAPSINPGEATTRTLEEQQPQASPPAQFSNSGNTGPSYAPPGQYPSFPHPPYPAVQPKKSYTALILGGGVLFLLLIVVVIGGAIVSRRLSAPDRPARASAPQTLETGKSASSQLSPEMAALLYPGAKVTMEVEEDGKEVVQMTSADPADKVVDWYTDKIHPTKRVNIPFAGGAVLKSDDMGVVITGAPPNVQIILKRE